MRSDARNDDLPAVLQRSWTPLLLVACLVALALPATGLAQSARPNVLLILVDDLNDWIGALEGHPQVRSPRIDALAAEGVLFTNAHAAATLCHPSRVSFMTGISPDRAGMRDNAPQPWRDFLPDAVSLNQAFRDAGYHTVGYSKVYHGNEANHDVSNWDVRRARPPSAMPPQEDIPLNGLTEIDRGGAGGGDWGILDRPDNEFEDHQVATWAVDYLNNRDPGSRQPFFLAVGLRATHSPWYFPPKYYNRIAGGVSSNIVLPPTIDNDLADVGAVARRWAAASIWEPLVTNKTKVREGVHGYLAAIAFADDQVGRILDALDSSAFASNTVVVLMSDHGYHLSEKQAWQKHNLWEEDTQVPLIFRVPSGIASVPAGTVDRPTSISAVFPTLLELAGIPLPDYQQDDPLYRVDYRSLVPLLENPTLGNWEGPAVAYGKNDSVTIRTAAHRLSFYPTTGFTELYASATDPNEWFNVASNGSNQQLVDSLTADAMRYLEGEHAPFGFREVCGAPDFNPSIDFGLHVWRECDGTGAGPWRLRVTSGGSSSSQTFTGNIASDGGFTAVIPYSLEDTDQLDNGINFTFNVAGSGTDGVNFAYPAGSSTCLSVPSAPTGARVYVGATRFPVTLPFDLETLAPCGATAPTGALGDLVWQDLDNDGVQDATEPGFANAEVQLLDCGDHMLATTTTDSTGIYRFGQLADGSYKLRFVAPPGYQFSPRRVGSATGGTDSNADPATGLSSCLTIADGRPRLGIDAGLVVNAGSGGTGAVGDFVWQDLDGDGTQDPGEPGFANAEVQLLDCSNNTLATTFTDAEGYYRFQQLAAGKYKNRFVLPAGYEFSPPRAAAATGGTDSNPDPVSGLSSCVSLADGQSRPGIDAGLVVSTGSGGTGAIGDFVWQDLDGDGTQDPGEPGFAGAEVRLLDCSNNTLATTFTDVQGYYRFSSLEAGSYRNRFVLPAGYEFSPPRAAAATGGTDSNPDPASGLSSCVPVADGQFRPGIDAGLVAGGSSGGGGTPLTSWTGATGGVSVAGNQISYSGSPTEWFRNTVNSAPFASLGFTGVFEVFWTIDTNPADSIWVVGLGVSETGPDRRDIEFGLRNSGGRLEVRENGTWRASGPGLALGDVISIAVANGTISFRYNGTTVYTSTYTGAPDFYVDTSFKEGAISLSVEVGGE
jgi:arylsulfatase A-like enzyme